MSFSESMRGMLRRAKNEASDVAQGARIRFELRSLQGKRDHLFLRIGRKVYATCEKPFDRAAIDPLLNEIAAVDEQIQLKESELRGLHGDGAAP